MENIIIAIVILIFILNLVGIVIVSLFIRKKQKNNELEFSKINNIENKLIEFSSKQEIIKKDFNEALNLLNEKITKFSGEVKEEINGKLNDISNNINKKLDDNGRIVNNSFKDLREEVDKKLDHLINKTNDQVANIKKEIDEHFKSELAKKLDEHFNSVQNKMKDLSENLIKFETLQAEIGDLSKTFSGVKSRGNFGEMLLENILQNYLPKEYWASQVNINKLTKNTKLETLENDTNDTNGDTRVDFIIKLLNKENEIKYLPIDSKFPTESFSLYQNAENKNDRDKALKKYVSDIKNMAKDIKKKYIKTGVTTDYAFMYLPSEALYATAVSDSDLLNELWTNCNVGLISPSTTVPQLWTIIQLNKREEFAKNIDKIADLVGYIKKNYGTLLSHLENSKNKIDTASEYIEKSLRNARLVDERINKDLKNTNLNISKNKANNNLE
ncbi:DNA recombination protein RmuC [Metamycoplasma buccale]|uniref:DNA recombination protein RmuC n=1 Tax=Metamycoplasma buccale TaxID=55602 RepID=UPI00398E87A7